MTNAELIKALRNCADYSDCGICKLNGKFNCADMMMRDAADALEKLQSDWEYCSDLLNIAIRATGISMTALVKLYEIERAGKDGEHDETDN